MTTPNVPFSVGFGYDVHRFAEKRRCVIGGVEIPYTMGLDGHSDADVLLHAIMDAMLGAAGLQDIGHQFPNTEERWKDSDSRDLLRRVAKTLRDRGWAVGNIDATLVVEAPKISPHLVAMRGNIGSDLGIDPSRVGIKATTNEQMGFVGRGEGIAAMAVALLMRV